MTAPLQADENEQLFPVASDRGNDLLTNLNINPMIKTYKFYMMPQAPIPVPEDDDDTDTGTGDGDKP